MNGSDCGMFACKFSEYLSRFDYFGNNAPRKRYSSLTIVFNTFSAFYRRKRISFTQANMPLFRFLVIKLSLFFTPFFIQKENDLRDSEE